MPDFDSVFTGTVVSPTDVLEDGFIAVADGKIVRVGRGPAPRAARVVEVKNGLIMPGAIDSQTHSRSQKDQEDFIWSTRSAAAGGVTTIVDMPYDAGRLICTPERLRAKAEEAGRQARVDFALYATAHPNDGPAHIAALVEAGACAFKFSTFGTDPERFPRIPPHVMRDCFAEIARFGLMAGVHNEDEEVIRALEQRVAASGVTDYRAHGLSRPVYSETLAINLVYELAADTGCRGHVVHCSTGRGYELCQSYRARGYATTIEACLHYLVLSEEDDVARLGGIAKVNPPVRGRAEREALWRHLAAGNITVVSTDHVSWSPERKQFSDFSKNASGVPGLEVLYSLLVKGCLDRGLPLSLAARVLAHNPAQLFNLTATKGALEVGKDADIAILKFDRHVYDPAASGHNCVSWSPYAGIELPVRVAATYLRGEPVFDGANVLAEPGSGRFITPVH